MRIALISLIDKSLYDADLFNFSDDDDYTKKYHLRYDIFGMRRRVFTADGPVEDSGEYIECIK